MNVPPPTVIETVSPPYGSRRHAADGGVGGVAEPGLVLGGRTEAALRYVGRAGSRTVLIVATGRDRGPAWSRPVGRIYDGTVGKDAVGFVWQGGLWFISFERLA